LRKQCEWSSLLGKGHPFQESCRTWSNRVLLLVATITLAFFVWNMVLHGMAVREDSAFQAWTGRLFLLLWFVLAFSLLLEAWSACQEGLKRQELPPIRGASSVRERSFRTTGPGQPLIRYCAGQMDKHFRRFYAFHRYQAPYVAYFYYAKKGSLSLLGLPWMKSGFLLLFLIGYTSLARGGFSDLMGWESTILGAGCFSVIAGLLIRVAVPYRKVWLRIVEENNRICLTLSCCGRPRDRWFEAFCRSIETQSGVVSCSIHSK